MKVCFLVGTLGRGGAERQVVFMLRALKQAGIESKLLCLTSGESFEAEIRDLGIDVQWIGSSKNRFVRLYKTVRAIRKYRPDIIQSSHFYTNIYVALAGRITGICNIGAVRNDLFSEIAADRTFGHWQFKLPQHLIANSALAVRRALSFGIKPDRIDLVRNIVGHSNNIENGGGKGVSIVFVGRLTEQKRPELFVRLAARLMQNHPDAGLTFRIVGDGPLRSEMERLQVELGLTGVDFLGERSDMSEIYRTADLLVLPSKYEGTPNVILEAMAHGIPVVATRVGGVPELLSDERGILVDPSDFDELVSATEKLIFDPGRREIYGKNGKTYVNENHSIDYLRERLGQIYQRLLDTSNR